MIELTYDSVLAIAEELVEEFGKDYVYQKHSMSDGGPQCRYVHEGKPDCIVGHILHRSGLYSNETWNRTGPVDYLLWDLAEKGLVKATPKAEHFLRALQSNQDGRMPWGQALIAAIKYTSATSLVERYDC